MDSTTRLDYALFQLTPTRTRCDLVIFAGRTSEKLASGLLQPFLTHLKFAKDQISKGGYSITLKSDTDAPWFTKSTLERFVRFISTPEVLERFLALEREIAQIQNSILSSEQRTAATESERNLLAVEANTNKSASFSGSKEESNGTNDAAHENSYVHLQRVLETRKAVLRKEQAMVYARALVAGFEMEYLNDLICFSDAFGSPRLREACINFMELCKKKNVDRVWRDEVAAMQVCSHSEFSYLGVSGIILSGGDGDPTRESMMDVHNGGLSTRKQNGIADTSISDSTISHGSSDTNQDNRSQTSTSIQSTDGKAQVPSSWPNHLPQYMQNFQGPVFPNVPHYQGYHFPGMQAPPYYRGNVAWPPNIEDARQGLSVDPNDHQTTKSSSKSKEKPSHGKEPPYSDLNDSTDGSDSHEYEEDGKRNSSIEGSRKRRHAKSSSRKFVIRNINYITPKRDGEQESASEEDGFIDGDSFKQQVEKAVESLERHHKSTLHSKKKQDGSKKINGVNSSIGFTYQDLDKVLEYNPEGKMKSEHWDMFQNLIMRDVDSRSCKDLQPVDALEHVTTMKSGEGMPFAFDEESEKVTQPRSLATDSFVITQRDSVNKDRKYVENFEAGNGALSVMKKDSTYEELFAQRIEEPNNYSRGMFSESATESSTIKSQKVGDWLLENVPDKSAHMFDRGNSASYVEDRFQFRRSGNDLVDDSLVVQARVVNDSSDSQQGTDIFMVSDFVGATELKNSSLELPEKVEATSLYEPDDLCMVLERDSAAEQSMATWTPEMDYGDNSKTADSALHSDVPLSDFVEKKLSSQDKRTKVRANEAPERKGSNKEAKSKASVRSLGKSKSEIELRSKKFSATKPLIQKSKSEMEEEKRKKMEELLIQRQKRIAERSTSSGFTPAASKKPLKDSKTEVASSKTKKSKGLAASDDSQNFKKPLLRSSTIDRIATARVTHKPSPTVSNCGRPAISKENGTVGTSLSQKTSGVEKKKPSLNKVKSLGKKPNTKILDGLPSSVCDTRKEDATEGASARPVGLKISQGILSSERVDDPENIKNSHYTFPVETNGMTIGNEVTSKVSPVRQEDIIVSETQEGPIPDSTMHSLPISVDKNLDSISFNIDNDATPSKKSLFSTEISVIENSTPSPSNEMSPEPSHSRRKWETTENSPTLTKGFRKLMLFGRKSLNSNVK